MQKVLTNPFADFEDEQPHQKQDNQSIYSTQQDITSKFFSKLPQTLKNNISKSKKHLPNQFLQTSIQIKIKLSQAELKIQKFYSMSQKAGLFSDLDSKLSEILSMVKEDLTLSQEQLSMLEQDNKGEFKQSILTILKQLTLRISQKFKNSLNIHTQKLKEQEQKRSKFGERDRLVRRGQQGHQNAKLFLGKEKNSARSLSPQENGDEALMMPQEKISEQKLSSMKKIESLLKDVSVVFQKIGTMVQMQETMIDRIDTYTEESQNNVLKGRKELQKAYERVASTRGLILKIFLILFIFSFIYVIFVV